MQRKKPKNKILSESVEIKGQKFTLFKSEDLIPRSRIEAYLSRHHEYENLGIRKDHLEAFCQTLLEYGNNGQYMQMVQLTGYFEALLKKPVTIAPITYLVSPLVLLNDENPEEMEGDYEDEKLRLALKHPEIESFFLTTLQNFGTITPDLLSSGQEQVYMNNQEKIIEQLFLQEITGSKTTT